MKKRIVTTKIYEEDRKAAAVEAKKKGLTIPLIVNGWRKKKLPSN